MPGAHPRLRGADALQALAWVAGVGSSPLTRGGQFLEAFFNARVGLIPAYAGRTPVWIRSFQAAGAHPRLRGADEGLLKAVALVPGSSPLTRGGLSAMRTNSRRTRLIPAYAGRTILFAGFHARMMAHPRLRGADDRVPVTDGSVSGSSPLTRGGLTHRRWPLTP